MKAIRIHKFGDTEDVLQYEDVPLPEPKKGCKLAKLPPSEGVSALANAVIPA